MIDRAATFLQGLGHCPDCGHPECVFQTIHPYPTKPKVAIRRCVGCDRVRETIALEGR